MDDLDQLIKDIDTSLTKTKRKELEEALERGRRAAAEHMNNRWPGTPWVPWGHHPGCGGGIYS